MNSKMFSDAMGEVDTKYIDQVRSFRLAVRRYPFRRMPAFLIAAVLALLLMGAVFPRPFCVATASRAGLFTTGVRSPASL